MGGVFAEAFNNPAFRQRLLTSIVELSIDAKLLTVLLAHYAGSPSKQVDHNHRGTVTLEQLITGTVPDDDDDEGVGE